LGDVHPDDLLGRCFEVLLERNAVDPAGVQDVICGCVEQFETAADLDLVNVNGGAIALGHPLGAAGARLVASLVHELWHRDGERGLVTMCCRGGLGIATLVEARAMSQPPWTGGA